MIGERKMPRRLQVDSMLPCNLSCVATVTTVEMASACPPLPYELGAAHRNYAHLEVLVPALNFDHVTEDYVIEFLLGDRDGDSAICAVIKLLEEHRVPGQLCVWLRHKRLVVPLLYEIGEGETRFRDRLIRRRLAGEWLGLVSPFTRNVKAEMTDCPPPATSPKWPMVATINETITFIP